MTSRSVPEPRPDERGYSPAAVRDDGTDLAAIQAAIDDWQAGDQGTPLDQALEQCAVQPNPQNGTLIGANLH